MTSKETPKKNPRVTISPEAYQALCIQAALEMLPPGTLASKMILSQAQEALQALQVTGREALPHKAQDQLPETERKPSRMESSRLSKNPQALARIKELLAPNSQALYLYDSQRNWLSQRYCSWVR